MLAVGLASVPFFNGLYVNWMERSINLPQAESASPIIVVPKSFDQLPKGGGSGPDQDDPVLSKKVIKNVTVANMAMSGTDLTEAEISEVDFAAADLSRAKFSMAMILYSGFIGADLDNADFSQARIVGSDFTDANLTNTKFVRTNLTGCDFSNTSFITVDITDANLSNARLENVRGLTYSQLKRAVINRYTTLPPYLANHRIDLLEQSLDRAAKLRSEMSREALDRYFNPFDLLGD